MNLAVGQSNLIRPISIFEGEPSFPYPTDRVSCATIVEEEQVYTGREFSIRYLDILYSDIFSDISREFRSFCCSCLSRVRPAFPVNREKQSPATAYFLAF